MASFYDRSTVEADVDATEDPVDNPSYVLRRLYEEVCPFRVGIRFADGIYHCSSKRPQEIAKRATQTGNSLGKGPCPKTARR
jgi:hypothetical protein